MVSNFELSQIFHVSNKMNMKKKKNQNRRKAHLNEHWLSERRHMSLLFEVAVVLILILYIRYEIETYIYTYICDVMTSMASVARCERNQKKQKPLIGSSGK